MADFDFQISGANRELKEESLPQIPGAEFDAESILLNATATAPETTPNTEATTAPTQGPEAVSDPSSPAPKKRGRPRKDAVQEDAISRAMSDFFSPAGIGALWVQGWQGFFAFCGAEKLPQEQEAFHAMIFAQWAKKRLPETPEKYQPDVMLLASIGMMAIPRLQPIATKTAPLWKRLGGSIAAKIKGIFKKG